MSKYVYAKFDQQSLDREYSPSSRVEDIKEYLRDYAMLSAEARNAAAADGSLIPDLPYGERAEETLDLFVPRNSDACALHVFIHGGYWQALSKDDSSFAAPMFLRNGVGFAAINYTLAPHQSLSGIVDENRRAIVYLYQHAERWGIDRNRITLSGSSAGAHLCLMLLLTDWPSFGLPQNVIKGVCAVSGVYDLEPVRLSYVNDAVGIDEQESRDMSPILHDLRNKCPIALAYGDNETAEFKRQTLMLQDKLNADGVETTFKEIANRNHFDVILDLRDEKSWLARQALGQAVAANSDVPLHQDSDAT